MEQDGQNQTRKHTTNENLRERKTGRTRGRADVKQTNPEPSRVHTPRSTEVDVSAAMDPLAVSVAMKVSMAK
jgi:hypothetical protein